MRTTKKVLRKKQPREAIIEAKVTQYAVEKGCLTIKLTPFGTNGWPDRLYVTSTGRHFYIEFKAKGGKLTGLQRYMLARLRERGVSVAVIDSIEDGIAHVNRQQLEDVFSTLFKQLNPTTEK